VPTDARGVPIQSYLDWQKANPGGTTINQTPAQPAAPSPSQWDINNRIANSMGAPQQNWDAGRTGQGVYNSADIGAIEAMRRLNGPNPNPGPRITANMTGDQIAQMMMNNPNYRNPWTGQAGGGGGTTLNQTQAAAPNNWDAALAALSNPGKVTTPGSPYTPSGPPTYGGGNAAQNAFLANFRGVGRAAGGVPSAPDWGPWMTRAPNTGFVDTLRRLQGGT
jgi:hypothetical protein